MYVKLLLSIFVVNIWVIKGDIPRLLYNGGVLFEFIDKKTGISVISRLPPTELVQLDFFVQFNAITCGIVETLMKCDISHR